MSKLYVEKLEVVWLIQYVRLKMKCGWIAISSSVIGASAWIQNLE
jgi:hypothetical protein